MKQRETINDNPVICLCWNCGSEIHADDNQNFINEEIWCDDCVIGACEKGCGAG